MIWGAFSQALNMRKSKSTALLVLTYSQRHACFSFLFFFTCQLILWDWFAFSGFLDSRGHWCRLFPLPVLSFLIAARSPRHSHRPYRAIQ